MSDFKTIVNSIGLILNIIGVYIIFINSPINTSEIDGGNASTDFDKEDQETKRKNRLMRLGVYIVILSSLFQLASNFIPIN